MAFKVTVLANCDDVFLAWDPGQEIPGCLGFAIERRLNGKAAVLENRVGFANGPQPIQTGSAPSTEYPFQRLTWTDHGPNSGDKVAYRITARVGEPGSFRDGPSSDWTEEVQLTNSYGVVEAYFNRGVVLSQFVGRLMKENNWGPADIKAHAGEVHDKLREFLSGELRQAMLRILSKAKADASTEVFAALFELSDPDLVPALAALGTRLHIVLGNGAIKKKGEDENAEARKTLVDSRAKVIDRMTAPTFLAHNKFLVITKGGKPQAVWTGSTNWQPTGLCTQANNGVLIQDASLADTYKQAWERLADGGNGHGKALKDGNTIEPPKVHRLFDGTFAFAQFTSVSKAIDMNELLDLIAGSRQSLLFAMFMPGVEIFDAAVARGSEIFVRGVANTFPRATPAPKENVDVTLVDNGQARKFGLEVVRPEGIENAFAYWAAEVTAKQFNAIGHAIIHSKVLVIDAWGDKPTVVTGSHNFSKTASQSNDENFVVITGNRALAQAYAVNCLGLYDHYRWREYVAGCAADGKTPWNHLSTKSDWLQLYRADRDRQALLGAVGI